jgi:glycosyltransferase involved in cell wall biosynthesis
MNTTPEISVLIPLYNSEKYLRETIDSVLNQTFGNFELLLMDDDSTDKTSEIVSSYMDDRIRYVKCKHNYVETFNYGLSIARGKYIALLDHDDIMMSRRLQIQYDYMEANPDVAACSALMRTFGSVSHVWSPPLKYEQIILSFIGLSYFINNPTGFIRRNIIDNHNIRYKQGFAFAADTKFWTDLVKIGKVVNLPEALVWYRRYDNQTSLITKTESHKVLHILYQEFIDFLLSKLDDNEKIKHVILKQFMPVVKMMADKSFFGAYIYFQFMSQIIEGLYNNGFLNLETPLNQEINQKQYEK